MNIIKSKTLRNRIIMLRGVARALSGRRLMLKVWTSSLMESLGRKTRKFSIRATSIAALAFNLSLSEVYHVPLLSTPFICQFGVRVSCLATRVVVRYKLLSGNLSPYPHQSWESLGFLHNLLGCYS